MPARNNALAYAALAGAILFIYAPSLRHGFVNYDDPHYVINNYSLHQGLTWDGIRWAFTTGYAENWHPLTWVSHMFDFSLYGMNPSAFRLTNVLLHTVSSIVLFATLRAMTSAPGRSFLVAALFAVHPLHVESVVWIAERKDVLSGLFWMLTLAAYAYYVQKRGAARYALVATSFALGLMAKPMLVTLPCVLLLLDYSPLGRMRDWRSLAVAVVEKLPLFALSIADSVATWLVQDAGGTMKTASALPWADRFANAAVAYASYIAKAVYPFDLAVLYPHRGSAIPVSIVALSAGMIFIASISSVLLLRRAPWFAVGWFWYFGTLAPVIGLIQVGDQSMADRYTYVPLVGLFVVVVWGLERLISLPGAGQATADKNEGGEIANVSAAPSFPRRREAGSGSDRPGQMPWIPAFAGMARGTGAGMTWGTGAATGTGPTGWRIFVAALLVLLTVQARVQAGYWRDSITLFEHCLEVTKTNGPAHNNLGRAYHDAGDLDTARAHYQKALVDSPGLVIALNNLGLLELAEGNLENAKALLKRVAELQPRDHRPRLNLGIVHSMLGESEKAEQCFRESIELAPDFPATRYSYGVFLLERGRTSEAIEQLEHALRVQPENADALAALKRARAAANAN